MTVHARRSYSLADQQNGSIFDKRGGERIRWPSGSYRNCRGCGEPKLAQEFRGSKTVCASCLSMERKRERMSFDLSTADLSPLWDRIEKSEGCWLWVGSVDKHGNPVVNICGKRAARPIINRLFGVYEGKVTVSCGDKRCLNPDHFVSYR